MSDRITNSLGRDSTGMGTVVEKAYFGFIVEFQFIRFSPTVNFYQALEAAIATAQTKQKQVETRVAIQDCKT